MKYALIDDSDRIRGVWSRDDGRERAPEGETPRRLTAMEDDDPRLQALDNAAPHKGVDEILAESKDFADFKRRMASA